jgi:Ca2+-dependent lipid-binding protein
VIPKTLNPVWDQTFEFLVEDAARDMLQLEVWDHDTFGKVSAFRLVKKLLGLDECR